MSTRPERRWSSLSHEERIDRLELAFFGHLAGVLATRKERVALAAIMEEIEGGKNAEDTTRTETTDEP